MRVQLDGFQTLWQLIKFPGGTPAAAAGATGGEYEFVP